MGRRHHLEQTLLKNIEDNLPTKAGDPSVEFVLVDYNSKDGLREWVENNAALKPYLENGTLVYARYPDAPYFHHAHAKNIAHRLATGDVVCNVDADNFTGKGFARYLAKEFAGGKHAFVHPSFSLLKGLPIERSGISGRIALLRKDFIALGGYSETRFKKGWGGEDADFLMRALAFKLKPRPMFDLDYLNVVSHSNEERIKNTAGGITVEEVEKGCGRISLPHLKLAFGTCVSSVQANRGGHFGEGTIFGIDNKVLKVHEAVESLPPIHRRCLRAILPMIKDRRIKPPQKTKVTLNAV